MLWALRARGQVDANGCATLIASSLFQENPYGRNKEALKLALSAPSLPVGTKRTDLSQATWTMNHSIPSDPIWEHYQRALLGGQVTRHRVAANKQIDELENKQMKMKSRLDR